jgi:hypothetical protein
MLLSKNKGKMGQIKDTVSDVLPSGKTKNSHNGLKLAGLFVLVFIIVAIAKLIRDANEDVANTI